MGQSGWPDGSVGSSSKHLAKVWSGLAGDIGEHPGAFFLDSRVGWKCMMHSEDLSGYDMAPQVRLVVSPIRGYVVPQGFAGAASQTGLVAEAVQRGGTSSRGMEHEVLMEGVELDFDENSLKGEIVEVAGPSGEKLGENVGHLMGGG
ncbi:hypothetical protein NDU88_005018 [Pleurodeles waltl]|uniref:Uncharacterized protein n=1 Tax=Pleurodeles waltl TaxID=8319 RepID=A0AAV7N019_PLEWA|nr:hypothetical protein NDU88_005018 [Pleurodeles waltl]